MYDFHSTRGVQQQNIPCVIQRVGFREDGVYADLVLPCEGKKVVS